MKDLTLKISFLLLQGILDQLIATSCNMLDPTTTVLTTFTSTDFREFGMHHINLDTKIIKQQLLSYFWHHFEMHHINLDTKIIKQQLLSYFWYHFEHSFRSNYAYSYSFLCGCSRCNQHPATTNFNNLN